ncbi:hypothetical protein GCM10027614_28390 [Micromonospora vulcania]
MLRRSAATTGGCQKQTAASSAARPTPPSSRARRGVGALAAVADRRASRAESQAGGRAVAASTGSANIVTSRVAFNPTGVCTSAAASTPAAESSAPTRTGRYATNAATTRLVSTARSASVRLMFIHPPSPNSNAVPASGTAAAIPSVRPSAYRRASSSATPTRPTKRPATGLVAEASSAPAAASARRHPDNLRPDGTPRVSASSAASPNATPRA